ncbi:acyltransferase domain-containing protein [Xylophilus sp. Kf1]|nr:acyltransferase domain-containing protein [Xylophilus sp. Kf1]
MSFALLFSGQGGQHADMLSWLPPQAIGSDLQAAIGADWRGRLADPAWAGRNAIAQPLLTGLALAAWQRLAPQLGPPAAVAGYSVGEVSAFCAAGVFDAAAALALARRRAACMDEAAAGQPTGLMGMTGLDAAATDRLCHAFGLQVAIRSDVDSVVLGGPRHAMPAAAEAAQAQGGRCTALNVALASHTRWMADAGRAFAADLDRTAFRDPGCPLFSNTDGRILRGEQGRSAMVRQLSHTVRWDDCMEAVASRQVGCVLEVGPGQALARLWNQRFAPVPARSVDEFRSERAIVDWVSRHGG